MNHPVDHFSESYLYHIWDGSHLRLDELRSSDGMTLEVIHRGTWNTDAGPDFLGALIRFDGELRQGDVEIHVKESEWFNHKHHLDRAYNQVILHAVLWQSPAPMSIVSQAGYAIPTLVLSNYLDESLARYRSQADRGIDRDKGNWPEVCPLEAKNAPFIKRRCHEWGLQRLREKMMRFVEQRRLLSFDELLYQGVCAALGYSKNQRPFNRLAQIVSLERIWRGCATNNDLVRLQGVILGAAGFLDDHRCHAHLPGSGAKIMGELIRHWHEFQNQHDIRSLEITEWRFFRLRPANFATVRLAGLCQLLARHREAGFFAPVLHTFRTLRDNRHRIFAELERQYRVAAYGIWQDAFASGSSQNRSETALIGTKKAREIVINAVLPLALAYAQEAEDHKLAALVKDTFIQAPKMQSNITTRKMAAQLGQPHGFGTAQACEQQGMIYMAGRLCRNWRCHECIHGPG